MSCDIGNGTDKNPNVFKERGIGGASANQQRIIKIVTLRQEKDFNKCNRIDDNQWAGRRGKMYSGDNDR